LKEPLDHRSDLSVVFNDKDMRGPIHPVIIRPESFDRDALFCFRMFPGTLGKHWETNGFGTLRGDMPLLANVKTTEISMNLTRATSLVVVAALIGVLLSFIGSAKQHAMHLPRAAIEIDT
jgi:hypothetical protein